MSDIYEMENPEDFCYCGECPVCEEPVDHDDAGFCESCGTAFHWGYCGTWHDGEHRCSNCIEALSEEDEDE